MAAIFVPLWRTQWWRRHTKYCNFLKTSLAITRLWKTPHSYNLDKTFLSASSFTWFFWSNSFCNVDETTNVDMFITPEWEQTILKLASKNKIPRLDRGLLALLKNVEIYRFLSSIYTFGKRSQNFWLSRVGSCGVIRFVLRFINLTVSMQWIEKQRGLWAVNTVRF